MLVFWVAAAALSLLAIGFVVGGALKASRTPSQADPTLGLYRRQMVELDDLIDRGLLAPAEQRIARAETGRRLLAAAEDEAVAGAGGKINQAAAIAVIIGLPVVALGVYLLVGAPGRPDQPYAGRIAEWTSMAKADPQGLGVEQLAAVLQQNVRARPNEVQGRRLLAELQLQSGQIPQALSNVRAAIALEPQHSDLWMMLGSAIMASNQGTFTPEAVTAFRKALELDPKSFDARYALGRAHVEAGVPAEGLALWRSLLVDLPADSPSRPELERQIAGVATTGRVPPRVDPPAQAQADANAPEMQAAIRGMVEGLANRLAENPDDPEGWVRLVRAYAVLGETDKLNSALTTARARYKNDPQLMAALAEAAEGPR